MFTYESHRTTRIQEKRGTNCVALEFVDADTGEPAVTFFNVDTKGRKAVYRTGQGQPFIPPERGKFRRWWLQVVGSPPRRWSRVHKELRARLSGLMFEADVEHCTTRKNETYLRLRNVRLAPEQAGTEKAQVEHNLGTEKAQVEHRKGTESVHSDIAGSRATPDFQPDSTAWQGTCTETQQPSQTGAQAHRHTGSAWQDYADENAREHFNERSAIAEYDGGLPREEAEARAARSVFEYKLSDPPGRWLVLLAAPGETYEKAVGSLRARFGDRLTNVRPMAREINQPCSGART